MKEKVNIEYKDKTYSLNVRENNSKYIARSSGKDEHRFKGRFGKWLTVDTSSVVITEDIPKYKDVYGLKKWQIGTIINRLNKN